MRRLSVIAWWMVWAAFQAGVFGFYFVLGRSMPEPPSVATGATAWVIGLAPLAASMVLRWGVLPRIADSQRAFSVFIVGIALAEACCFLGLFLFPAEKLILFLASAVGILQFVPLFASQYSE